MRVSLFATLGLPLLLSGCSLVPTSLPIPDFGRAIRGNVHGGQQPINGARVYLLAAGTSGYGSVSTSLLTSGTDGSDSVGGYVLTAADGSFSIGGTYTCTPNTQVYLYALGGDPGAGVNSAAGLLAALGNCPSTGNFAATVPFVSINEVTTVAAAYAFSAFATDATHVGSSGTPLALTGIANAFANAANLADLGSGQALAATPAGNGTAPQTEINTLANILAACVNSTGSGSTPCSTLFSNAMSAGASGTTASDTATAAINIAHNPVATVAALYGIAATTPPFGLALTAQPADFSVSLAFNGGGITSSQHMAIDAQGDIWATDLQHHVLEFNNLGAPLSPSTGYNAATLTNPSAIAIDNSGNAWVISSTDPIIIGISSAGALNAFNPVPLDNIANLAIDPSGNLWATSTDGQDNLLKFASNGGYTATYPNPITGQPGGLAIDPAGNIWVSNATDINDSVSEFTPAGAVAPNSPFYNVAYQPSQIAFDSSSNVWTMSSNTYLDEMSSAGVQVPGAPYAIGALTGNPSSSAIADTFDGSNTLWAVIASTSTYYAVPVSNSGSPLTSPGYVLNAQQVTDVAIDGSGNLWADGYDHLVELVGAAAPVTTPIVTAVTNNTLAARP